MFHWQLVHARCVFCVLCLLHLKLLRLYICQTYTVLQGYIYIGKKVWNCLLCGNVWKYSSCRKICAKRSIWFHQMRIVSARLVVMHVPSCRTAWRCRSMCAIWRRNWSGTSTPMVVPRQRRKPSRMPWMQMQKKIQGCSVKALAQQELVKNLLNRPLKMHWTLISMARCDSRLQMHRWKFTTHWLNHSVCKPWSSIVKSTPSLWETWSLRVCFLWQQTKRVCIEQ